MVAISFAQVGKNVQRKIDMIILLQSMKIQFRRLLLVQQNLLQNATGCYYKVRQVLRSVTGCYYKVRQVLQSATDFYYKVRQVLQSVTALLLSAVGITKRES